MEAADNFAERVITVLEKGTRRWRYWDSLMERVRPMSDTEVLLRIGWTKSRIESEREIALLDLLAE